MDRLKLKGGEMRFLLQDPNLVVWICDSVIAFIFDENYNNFGNISEIECEKYYFEIEDTRIHLLKDNEIEKYSFRHNGS